MLRKILLLLILTLPVSGKATSDPIPIPHIIPRPASMSFHAGELVINPGCSIRAKSPELLPLARILSDEIFRTADVRFVVGGTAAHGIQLAIDPALKTEEYRLTSDNSVRISGGSYRAVAYGTATLLQCISIEDTCLLVPHCSIDDAPTYAYRGALLDLGRKYHTAEGIQQVIELCRLYKIGYLHLHLSDDQLFMFPSAAYPQLGKSNSEFARFEPGSKPHIDPYTRHELRDLDEFAAERGVYLVPEIDLPGHSGRMIADAPGIFGFPGNGSTINIASPQTVAAIKTLLGEVMDVFKNSPYIHLGADEVGLGGLENTDEYKQSQAALGVKSLHELYCKFVSEMHDFVASRGKRMIVWEEACNADGPYPLPKDTLVMIWSLGRNPADVVKQGYTIINASWTPLYIVRNNRRSPEFLYKWAASDFGREASDDYTRLQDTAGLAGAQLCSWEDSESIEIQSLRERLPIVAAKLWNPASSESYVEFRADLQSTARVADSLICPISISAAARFAPDENTFTTPLTLTLTSEKRDPRLRIRYTLDNSLPGPTWKPYAGPLKLDKTFYLRAGLFDKDGQQFGYLVGSWFRAAIPVKPNLATGRPVTVGPSPDRTDEWAARVAVDGQSDDPMRHWASVGEAPQWLMVDLGKPVPINYINVITYWDGPRYYQWNAEASEDGKTWKRVLDFSTNLQIATASGYSGRFPTTTARYVRINMLKNSANQFVHIVELIVENRK